MEKDNKKTVKKPAAAEKKKAAPTKPAAEKKAPAAKKPAAAPAKKATTAKPAEKKVVAKKVVEKKAAPTKPVTQKKPAQKRKEKKAPKSDKPWHRTKGRSPIIIARPKNFRIGNDLPPKRDLTRFVHWPWYIRLQRQKRILFNRLKVPPPIHQFSMVLNRVSAAHLFRLLNKMRPEERAARKRRRLELAKDIVAARKARHLKQKKEATDRKEAAKKELKKKDEKAAAPLVGEAKKDEAEAPKKAEKKPIDRKAERKARNEKIKETKAKKATTEKGAIVTEKPVVVKYGLNHVTRLVENNKAQLVVIASDVEPIELVVWLPALCRKKKVPYCIVKNKSRLGRVVHKKTSAVLAITNVPKDERPNFAKLIEAVKVEFNDNPAVVKTHGGQKLGVKRRQLLAKRARILKAEELRKAKSHAGK